MMASARLCTRLSYEDFLCFDGPTGEACGPSDSRSNFYRHLGLQERNFNHQMLYGRMKKEALAGLERLHDSRKCLRSELVHDETVMPPYTVEQITESAFRQEVLRIYETASRQTKGIYDLINTSDISANWVIRWMLWRVIQHAQHRGVRAPSSGAESDSSMPSLCSTATDYPTIRTEQMSPPWSSPPSNLYLPLVALSPVPSDDQDWDESPRKRIKLDPDQNDSKAGIRRTFWNDVLNT